MIQAMTREVAAVCCVCQGTHPARLRGSRGEKEDLAAMLGDRAEEFEMLPHRLPDSPGIWCGGAGTTPQALVSQ
jgi:hypothetical protein